jgi:hypothetical protein
MMWPRRHEVTEKSGIRFSLVMCSAALCCACGLFGPSEDVTGTWEARGRGTIPSFIYLDLHQSGDSITGTACYVASGGTVLYKAAPISTRYPNVKWVATESRCSEPLCAASFVNTWTGRVDKTGDIVPTADNEFRFRRSENQSPACLPR